MYHVAQSNSESPAVMRSLAVIYTGGTIGMQPSGDGLAPAHLDQATLKAEMPGAEHLASLDLIALDPLIDSADADPSDWRRIGGTIADLYEAYDAFIVLHGTDTMAFTAASLSFQLKGLAKPVILTGSQRPLGQTNSDAPANLALAFLAAQSSNLTGVVIAFGGKVLSGTRAKKLSSVENQAFDSPSKLPLAVMAKDGLIWNQLPPKPATPLQVHRQPSNPESVLTIRVAPGFAVHTFKRGLDHSIKAIVLETYGSGTGPASNPRFMALLEDAAKKHITVVAVSQCLSGGVHIGTYAAGAALSAAGVVSAGEMTFEAAYAKLHHLIALGLSDKDLGAAFVTPILDEM